VLQTPHLSQGTQVVRALPLSFLLHTTSDTQSLCTRRNLPCLRTSLIKLVPLSSQTTLMPIPNYSTPFDLSLSKTTP